MQTMAISDFKAHALRAIDSVAKSGEEILVTKRGKPMVRVIPYHDDEEKNVPGLLAGALVEEVDVSSPIDAEWDVLQ